MAIFSATWRKLFLDKNDAKKQRNVGIKLGENFLTVLKILVPGLPTLPATWLLFQIPPVGCSSQISLSLLTLFASLI